MTRQVEDRANALLRAGNAGVKRVPLETAMRTDATRVEDSVEVVEVAVGEGVKLK